MLSAMLPPVRKEADHSQRPGLGGVKRTRHLLPDFADDSAALPSAAKKPAEADAYPDASCVNRTLMR